MMCIVMMMMINVLFYISIMRETSSCTSRKGGWLIKSLSLKMSLVFRETRLETKFKFTKRREKLFLTTRTRMMMTCTSLPLLLLKLLRFLNRFCSSFFSSSSSLLSSSSVLLLLLLLRAGVGVFPSSSAFSFAVSLPSRISVLRRVVLLKREKKRVSQKFSLLSFFLSLETRANASAVSGGESNPLIITRRNSPKNSKPWTV